MTRVVVFGRNGQVGRHVCKLLADEAAIELHVFDRSQADLSSPETLSVLLESIKPEIIVNAAAYTAVDQAETETELAHAINAEAPAVLASYCAKSNALLIHYSTDYVFDGDAESPYLETDSTDPQGVYGETKLAGERAIRESGCKHYILRTAWVYDGAGKNFLLTMLRLAGERDSLSVVDDQQGSPTYAYDLAAVTIQFAKAYLTDEKKPFGIYHATNRGETSWCGFAQQIMQDSGNSHVQLNGISTDQYPTPAKRPAYSVLSGEKLAAAGLSMPPWQDALMRCLKELPA